MKQLTNGTGIKAFFATIVMALYNVVAMAQESPEVKINNTDVGSWIGQNWLWVVGIIVLLLIILFASGGKRSSSKTTTVRRDDTGRITSTTTVINE